jgi:hypothetical protein
VKNQTAIATLDESSASPTIEKEHHLLSAGYSFINGFRQGTTEEASVPGFEFIPQVDYLYPG